MKAYTVQELDAFFRSLESTCDVRVPVARHDGTRTLGAPDEGPLKLAGGVVLKKITNVFFPQLETILVAGPDGVAMPAGPV